MRGCIYRIINPEGKIYVGQTRKIGQRFAYYKNHNCKKQKNLFYSLEKYGFGAHVLEILCVVPVRLLNELEIYFIKKFDAMESGLNILSGGIGGSQNEETRAKMSRAKLGTKQSPEAVEKRANKLRGRKRTEREIELTRAALVGRKLSIEHVEKLRIIHKGKIPPSQKGRIPWNKGKKLVHK